MSELAGGKLRLDRPAPHVARLTIDNPAKRNALDHEILDAIAATARELDDARCLLLTAVGPVFCAGYDIGGLPRDQFAHQAESLVAHPFQRRDRGARRVPVSRRRGAQRPRDRRRARAGADLRPADGGHRHQARDAAGQARARLLPHRPAQVHRRGRGRAHARAVLHRPQRQRRRRVGVGDGHRARAAREARRARGRLRGGDRRQRAALAGRQQARDPRAAGRRGRAGPGRSRPSSSRCARPASAPRTSTRACARSPRSGPRNGRAARPSSSRWRCGASHCARRPAPGGVARLGHLGPGAQADAEPQLAPLGHPQAHRHHRARARRVPRRPPRLTARAGRRPLAAATAATSAPATAGSATCRTRTGSTSTSTTRASTASSAPRGGPTRSMSWRPRSSSTASSRGAP